MEACWALVPGDGRDRRVGVGPGASGAPLTITGGRPAGPLTFITEWPKYGIGESKATVVSSSFVRLSSEPRTSGPRDDRARAPGRPFGLTTVATGSSWASTGCIVAAAKK
jgi:hypothetical protein